MSSLAQRAALLAAQQRDNDAYAWRQAVWANGGGVSSRQYKLVSNLIKQLKACGAWALTDDYALYACENQVQALVTLKLRATQTLGHFTSTNASFVAQRGFLGNKDGYIQTAWNPSTGTNYTQNNARFGIWVYSAAATTATKGMGADNNIDNTIISLRNNGMVSGANGTGACVYNTAGGFISGLLSSERPTSSALFGYQNGAQVSTNGSATSSPGQNTNFKVLANDNALDPAAADAGISMAFYGASLTSAIRTAEYAALRQYMTSMGVQ